MSALIEYDTYISKDFSRDYWADDAIDFATELAGRLTQNDWTELKIMWRHKPLPWQEKCSQSISILEVEQAVSILEDMLTSPSKSVALLAVEGLQANDKWLPTTSHLLTLAELSKNVDLIDLENIKILILRGS